MIVSLLCERQCHPLNFYYEFGYWTNKSFNQRESNLFFFIIIFFSVKLDFIRTTQQGIQGLLQEVKEKVGILSN